MVSFFVVNLAVDVYIGCHTLVDVYIFFVVARNVVLVVACVVARGVVLGVVGFGVVFFVVGANVVVVVVGSVAAEVVA